MKKKCAHCKKTFSTDKFYKNKASKDGFNASCKSCRSVYQKKYYASERGKAAHAAYRRSDHVKLANRKCWLKTGYGITLEKYNYILMTQGGVCAACGRFETYRIKNIITSLSVDHDHKTGKIRGLLCRKCNLALGNVEDSKERLLQLAIYLEQSSN